MKKTIFVAFTSKDSESLRDELMITLLKAGFNVIPLVDCPKDEQEFLELTNASISSSHCAIHILGKQYGEPLETNEGQSRQEFQIELSKQVAKNKPGFGCFIWQPWEKESIEPRQLAIIRDVQNSVSLNMTYTNCPTPIQMADDIRELMEVEDKQPIAVKATDVFFINNLNDENSAGEITDMLEDIISIEKLTVSADSETDFSEFTKTQIGHSKLAVIYFKDSGDWALPFAQQIWKKVGGASSPAPILLIGDKIPETNNSKRFSAPKIISMIIAGELIPLEIKIQFDQLDNTLS